MSVFPALWGACSSRQRLCKPSSGLCGAYVVSCPYVVPPPPTSPQAPSVDLDRLGAELAAGESQIDQQSSVVQVREAGWGGACMGTG